MTAQDFRQLRRRDFPADLGRGQYAAMAGLRALAELEFDHFDLIAFGVLFEFFGAERAVGIAAAEVA